MITDFILAFRILISYILIIPFMYQEKFFSSSVSSLKQQEGMPCRLLALQFPGFQH
jgi:hypothetical protein